MKTLIIKLGATGDVLRTSTLLDILDGEVHWITADENISMITGSPSIHKGLKWSQATMLENSEYDLVINLEDSVEASALLNTIKHRRLFGAYLDGSNALTYTVDSSEWFDLSLISRFGRKRADELKFINDRSYQEIIFKGLGHEFKGEKYYLPEPKATGLSGDIAVASTAGPVWPMKKWAYYDELKALLEADGFRVNMLAKRPTLLEHISDVQGHRLLISGDSLPMHIALGSGIRCVTIFQCTSPWEIYDYGLQTKLVSPLIEEYFYKRNFEERATTSIDLQTVHRAVLEAMDNA